MDEKNYFDVVKRIYDITGLRISSKPLARYLSVYLLFPLSILLDVLVLVNFKHKGGDIFGIVQAFESVSVFGILFIRKFTLIFFQGKIEEIISDRNAFWKIDSFDKYFIGALYKKLSTACMEIKFFWAVCLFLTTIFTVSPLFLRSASLPFPCWMPFDNKFFHVFIYIIQCIFIYEALLMTGPCDVFFFLMCKDFEVQLQLIGRTVQNIRIGELATTEKLEECLTELKQCCSYHRFLLKVHQNFGTIFSIYFLAQYVVNIIGLTIQFYLISTNGSDIVIMVRCILYVMAVILQGSIGFIPATNVEIEAEHLCNEIYNVDWYNTPNMKIRKFILFWLMKAQEPLEMSGGGLMKINRNLFLQIPKTSFSIHTLLK